MTLLFTEQMIFSKFKASEFYHRFYQDLGARILSPVSFKSIFSLVRHADIIQVEQAGKTRKAKIALMLSYVLGKKVIIHPHATNVELGAFSKRRSFLVANHPIMVSTSKLIEVYQAQGFQKFIPVGFPKYFPEWLSLSGGKDQNPDHILIFSRAQHPIWMPEILYIKLLKDSIETSRKIMGELPVIVKVHPREDRKFLESLIQKMGWDFVSVSEENSLILARKAKVAIGFFTSALFDSYVFDVPSVDYYHEGEAMKQVYPHGRSNKLLKLDIADSREELEQYLLRVKSGKYQIPEFIRELRDSSR